MHTSSAGQCTSTHSQEQNNALLHIHKSRTRHTYIFPRAGRDNSKKSKDREKAPLHITGSRPGTSVHLQNQNNAIIHIKVPGHDTSTHPQDSEKTLLLPIPESYIWSVITARILRYVREIWHILQSGHKLISITV